MGNSHPKYLTSAEALDIIGTETWENLRSQLGREGNELDFSVFSQIITSYFDKVPKIILESIYNGFAADINTKIKVDDFIPTLALVTQNPKRSTLAQAVKFLFRVYDYQGKGIIDRIHVEKILLIVYGTCDSSAIDARRRHLDLIFRVPRISNNHNSTSLFSGVSSLTLKDFENSYEFLASDSSALAIASVVELSKWIQIVLRALIDPLPLNLQKIANIYSLSIENKFIIQKYNVSEKLCNKLRNVYCRKFQSQNSASIKIDVTLSQWEEITSFLMNPSTARMTFLVFTKSFKPIWRFAEFVNFCLIFGRRTKNEQIGELLNACYRYFNKLHRMNDNSITNMETFFTTVLLILAHDDSVVMIDDQSSSSPASPKSVISDTSNTLFGYCNSDNDHATLPVAMMEEFHLLFNNSNGSDIYLPSLVDLVIEYQDSLPGLKSLSMTAACLFGVKPMDPLLQQEYIFSLMVKNQMKTPQTSTQPYGPEGSEWCVISKTWYDQWKLFVGHKRMSTLSLQDANLNAQNAPQEPRAIDNSGIVKRTELKQLLQGVILHHDIEVMCPPVFNALSMWYDGGPEIVRKVIRMRQFADESSLELELFPISLRIFICLASGKAGQFDRELLFSRSDKIQDIVNRLADLHKIESSRMKLWNFANPNNVREQVVLAPSDSVEDNNLQDGQSLLMEISLPDGTWPRSQFLARLDEEEKQQIKDPDSDTQTNILAADDIRFHAKAARVGLDNLGNTCYLNASLQALFHTKHLVDYFLSRVHMDDINVDSKFGYNGKLAYSFGKLIQQIYALSPHSSLEAKANYSRLHISPRSFINQLCSIHKEFAGNRQHDAQELLAFLLDGLSEDLNLVDTKPYTEQPDSDGREDKELAEIWWENHLKRDLSIIQALFMGQFKSVMTCACGHASARFEPFSFLAVPIPEEYKRVMVVHVVLLEYSHAVMVKMCVDRRGDLSSLVDGVKTIFANKPLKNFAVIEVINSKVHVLFSLVKKLEYINDDDNLFFYETDICYPGIDGNVKSLQLPLNSDKHLFISSKTDEVVETVCNDDSIEALEEKSNDISREIVTNEDEQQSIHGSRVSFIQRRLRLHSSDSSVCMNSYSLDVFGLPFVEVIDSSRVFSGSQLYDLISKRVSRFLNSKYSVKDLLQYYQIEETSPTISLVKDLIPSSDEDIFAGAIPRNGFSLRIVQGGGSSSGCLGCARCDWFSRCRGCLIPDSCDVFLKLRDGETLAVDWHLMVFEELLDVNAASNVRMHSSMSDSKLSLAANSTTLQRCFDKFTEEEPIEDIVCPKCRESNKLKTKFTLWRLPPILVIQLKRFQFDNVSRRKINKQVVFPVDGLDLSAYMANNDSCNDQVVSSIVSNGCIYDLYGVIHHIGALSGGHYVAAIRSSSLPFETKDSSTWTLYNDDLATEIKNIDEVSAGSAYLLFYTRRDTQDQSLEDLFSPFRSRAPARQSKPRPTFSRDSIDTPAVSSASSTPIKKISRDVIGKATPMTGRKTDQTSGCTPQ